MPRTLRPFLLLLPSLAFAQFPHIPFGGGFSGGPDGIKGDATFHIRPIQLMANAPYSGEEKTETVQTLADGTHVTRSNPRNTRIWRDSQGRVRIEEGLGGGPNHPTLVEIDDPVTGYTYILDDINKVAHRAKASVIPERNMDPMNIRRPPVGSVTGGGGGGGGGAAGAVGTLSVGAGGGLNADANPRPRPQTSGPEDLGTSLIDGVTVRGSRTATVIPTGAQGNDAPITNTRDTWYSPELNLIIRTVSTDPRSGVQTTGIDKLSRSDPDLSLFMVPADYQLVDEVDSKFTINWDTRAAAKTK
jgi:hypothetical protein